MIKYGVILDESLTVLLENNVDRVARKDSSILEEIIERCCRLKAYVVQEDEKESGLRAILNFGHTLGHALEAISDYQVYLHGEAVAIGMVYASSLAVNKGLWQDGDHERLVSLIRAYGLPTDQKDYPMDDLIPFLMNDKKCVSGKMVFVLPKAFGEVSLFDDVTVDDLKRL